MDPSSGTFSYQASLIVDFSVSKVISGSGGNGVGIFGANDDQVAQNFISTDVSGAVRLGNARNGMRITQGAGRNMSGGLDSLSRDRIAFSGGNGVTIQRSKRARVLGNEILSNQGYGVFAQGICDGSLVQNNLIEANTAGTVDLTKSRGVTYVS